MSFAFDRLIEGFAGRPGDGIFTGRINLGDYEPIRALERGQELLEEIPRAGKAVRLKKHRQRSVPTVAYGADGGPYFRRMMAIVVYHHDAVGLALEFEAAMDAAERCQRFDHMGERDFQLAGDGNGRQRIGGAVSARELQAQLTQRLAMLERGELHAFR